MLPANLIKRQKQHFHTYEDLGERAIWLAAWPHTAQTR